MTWAKLVLAILSLIQTLLRMGQEHKWIAVGEDREIARGLAKTLQMTEFSKNAMREIAALSDSGVDDLLHRMEPGGTVDEQSGSSSKR